MIKNGEAPTVKVCSSKHVEARDCCAIACIDELSDMEKQVRKLRFTTLNPTMFESAQHVLWIPA